MRKPIEHLLSEYVWRGGSHDLSYRDPESGDDSHKCECGKWCQVLYRVWHSDKYLWLGSECVRKVRNQHGYHRRPADWKSDAEYAKYLKLSR